MLPARSGSRRSMSRSGCFQTWGISHIISSLGKYSTLGYVQTTHKLWSQLIRLTPSGETISRRHAQVNANHSVLISVPRFTPLALMGKRRPNPPSAERPACMCREADRSNDRVSLPLPISRTIPQPGRGADSRVPGHEVRLER